MGVRPNLKEQSHFLLPHQENSSAAAFWGIYILTIPGKFSGRSAQKDDEICAILPLSLSLFTESLSQIHAAKSHCDEYRTGMSTNLQANCFKSHSNKSDGTSDFNKKGQTYSKMTSVSVSFKCAKKKSRSS